MVDVKLPSADELVLRFAKSRMSVPVVVQVPATRPAEFLQVGRVGGGPLNRVLDAPVIVAYAWAGSKARAEEIASEFRDLILNRVGEMPLVRGVDSVVGPYSDPDPDSKVARYAVTSRWLVRASRR